MEQIIAHFTGTTTFDKLRIEQIAAGLHHGCSTDQISIRDAHSNDSADAISEDEEFVISAVSPTTACMFAIGQGWTLPGRSYFSFLTAKVYSGELSHSNFSIRVQKKVDNRLHTTFPEVLNSRSPKAPASYNRSISISLEALPKEILLGRHISTLYPPRSSMPRPRSRRQKLRISSSTFSLIMPRRIIHMWTNTHSARSFRISIRYLLF